MKIIKAYFHEQPVMKADIDAFLKAQDPNAIVFFHEAEDNYLNMAVNTGWWCRQFISADAEQVASIKRKIIDSDSLPPPAGCITELTMLKLVAAAAHPLTVIK